MRLTPECRHDADAGCYHCCQTCNRDAHRCPGCGQSLDHAEPCCSDCEAEIRRERFRLVLGGVVGTCTPFASASIARASDLSERAAREAAEHPEPAS